MLLILARFPGQIDFPSSLTDTDNKFTLSNSYKWVCVHLEATIGMISKLKPGFIFRRNIEGAFSNKIRRRKLPLPAVTTGFEPPLYESVSFSFFCLFEFGYGKSIMVLYGTCPLPLSFCLSPSLGFNSVETQSTAAYVLVVNFSVLVILCTEYSAVIPRLSEDPGIE